MWGYSKGYNRVPIGALISYTVIRVLMGLDSGFYRGCNMGSTGRVSLRIEIIIGLLAGVLTRV